MKLYYVVVLSLYTIATALATPHTVHVDVLPQGAVIDGIISNNEYGPGNSYYYQAGGSGFGNHLAQSTALLKSDAQYLHIAFDNLGNLNNTDVFIMYFDTKNGGYSTSTDDPNGMHDDSDGVRFAVTTLASGNGAVERLPFLADFALVWNREFSVLFELTPKYVPLRAINHEVYGLNTPTPEFRISRSDIGLTILSRLHFNVLLISNTGYLSGEGIPPPLFNSTVVDQFGNPGFNTSNIIAITNYNTFVPYSVFNVCSTNGSEMPNVMITSSNVVFNQDCGSLRHEHMTLQYSPDMANWLRIPVDETTITPSNVVQTFSSLDNYIQSPIPSGFFRLSSLTPSVPIAIDYYPRPEDALVYIKHLNDGSSISVYGQKNAEGLPTLINAITVNSATNRISFHFFEEDHIILTDEVSHTSYNILRDDSGGYSAFEVDTIDCTNCNDNTQESTTLSSSPSPIVLSQDLASVFIIGCKEVKAVYLYVEQPGINNDMNLRMTKISDNEYRINIPTTPTSVSPPLKKVCDYIGLSESVACNLTRAGPGPCLALLATVTGAPLMPKCLVAVTAIQTYCKFRPPGATPHLENACDGLSEILFKDKYVHGNAEFWIKMYTERGVITTRKNKVNYTAGSGGQSWSIDVGSCYYARVFNVDDASTMTVNGRYSIHQGYRGDSGYVNITKWINKGHNSFYMRVRNNYDDTPWTRGFHILRKSSYGDGGSSIYYTMCGDPFQSPSVGCGGNNTGIVWSDTYLLIAD